MCSGRISHHFVRAVQLLLFSAATGFAVAAEKEALPQPLTLEYALGLAEYGHPVLQQVMAEKQAAEASHLGARSGDDLSVTLEARARWVMPPESIGDEVLDDHKASLFVRKSLYDFGRTGALRQATSAELESMGAKYRSQREQHRLDVMQAFFDVIYADKENSRDNEALAIAFIRLDRTRNRQELGQRSDIEILELESAYQKVLHQLNISSAQQRIQRSRLANILNRPGDLPAELVMPELNLEGSKLPEYEHLLELAEQNNPLLKQLKLELIAAEQRVKRARSDALPSLDAELEASSYERDLGGRDRWRAGVTLTVPLYNGDRVDAAVASQQASVMKVHARLSQAQHDLRQMLLENWFLLQRLEVEREKAFSELDYRELYLDRSRANYEMEVAADLGDAMVRLSDAQLALLKNDFDTALAWEQLRALVGVDMDQLVAQSSE